jgi:hypothetical protein
MRMKLTTVTAALAVTLALAPSAHARGYHVRAAFSHRQSVYHQGVFRHGGYQYAGQRSDQGSDRSWAWRTENEGYAGRRGWSGAQEAWRYRNVGEARPSHYARGSRFAGGYRYRAASPGRFTARYEESRTPAYSGNLGPRPSAWCGWQMRQFVGSDPGPAFNLARQWAQWGHAGPAGVGAVVVWPHHVGMIVGRENGQWIVKSGNDGNRVRTRALPISNAIAIRWS